MYSSPVLQEYLRSSVAECDLGRWVCDGTNDCLFSLIPCPAPEVWPVVCSEALDLVTQDTFRGNQFSAGRISGEIEDLLHVRYRGRWRRNWRGGYYEGFRIINILLLECFTKVVLGPLTRDVPHEPCSGLACEG